MCQVTKWARLVPLRRESSTTIARHLLSDALVVIQGAEWAALAPEPFLMQPSLCSSTYRAVKQFCKGISSFRESLLLLLVPVVASFHSSALLPPPTSVHAHGGVFSCLAMGCGSTANCAWNQLSNSFSAPLMLWSLLTASCSSATCCRRSSTLAHLLQTGLLPDPAPGERSRHCLWSEVRTAASPFSSSTCAEALATAAVDGADPPARAAAFALRQVTTILLGGAGRMSALDLCRWSQNSTQLLGYVHLKSPIQAVECSSFKEMPSLYQLPCQAPFAHCICSTPQLQRSILPNI